MYVCVRVRGNPLWKSHCTNTCSYSASSEYQQFCPSLFSLFQLRITLFSMLVPNRVRPAIIRSHGFSQSAYLYRKVPEYFDKSLQLLFMGILDLLLVYSFCVLLISVCSRIFCWKDELLRSNQLWDLFAYHLQCLELVWAECSLWKNIVRLVFLTVSPCFYLSHLI